MTVLIIRIIYLSIKIFFFSLDVLYSNISDNDVLRKRQFGTWLINGQSRGSCPDEKNWLKASQSIDHLKTFLVIINTF